MIMSVHYILGLMSRFLFKMKDACSTKRYQYLNIHLLVYSIIKNFIQVSDRVIYLVDSNLHIPSLTLYLPQHVRKNIKPNISSFHHKPYFFFVYSD